MKNRSESEKVVECARSQYDTDTQDELDTRINAEIVFQLERIADELKRANNIRWGSPGDPSTGPE